MIRRIAFILLVVVAIACGAWGYFYLRALKKPAVAALDVLPDTCYALVEIREPKTFAGRLTGGNLMWEELLRMSSVKKFNALITYLDSVTNGENIREYLGNEPVYVALYGDAKNKNAVLAFNLPDVNETEHVKEFFEKTFSGKKQSNSVYQCMLNDGMQRWGFTVFIEQGLVILSENAALVNELSAKNKKNALTSNSSFVAASKTTAHDNGFSVYLHLPRFYNSAWNDFFTPASNTYFTDRQERWIAGDVNVQPNQVRAEGFLPADSTSLSKLIRSQEPDNLGRLYASLPYAVNWFEAVVISDYGSFIREKYNGNIEQRRADLKTFSDSLAHDAQNELVNLAGNYFSVFEITAGDTALAYGLLDLKDAGQTLSFLKNTADSILANTDTANYFHYNRGDLFSKICAGFYMQSFSYVTVHEEHAVFCNSVAGLQLYKKMVNDKFNFHENERGMAFISDNFNAEVNYLFYANVFKTRAKVQSCLSPSMVGSFEEAPELYEKFDAIAFSLQRIKGEIYFNACAGFNPKYKMYRNTLWEAMVDTDLVKMPVAIQNHLTGETELACEDLNNNLYLLSNTGRVLWKKHIGERIFGDVQQIDYFDNGKLQMLFSTENYIHLLDRNGNYVKDFPVRIRAGAAGPVSVFDYDHTRKYRLWLPLKNNTVVCLSAQCKLVDGFIPVSLQAPAVKPVKQLVLQQKDYFVLTDTSGAVYVTSRKGEGPGAITQKLPGRDKPVYYDIGKDASKTYLCYVDLNTRELCKLSLDDKLEKIQLPVKKDPLAYFFDTTQAQLQVVLVYENGFEAFDFFGKETIRLRVDPDLQPEGACLPMDGKTWYASLSEENGSLLLANPADKSIVNDGIRLSALPSAVRLIKDQPAYLVGFYQNRIFCVKQ